MSDPSETSSKEKYLPYVDQDSDFFFLFFLLKFIAITQSHFLQGYCQASVIPLEIFFFFAFSLLTQDFACFLLKLHLLISGLLSWPVSKYKS